MKHLKKIMSLILTAIMVIAMCVPVMADDSNYIITINDNDKAVESFAAYQVFKGEISGGKLINIDWGKNISNQGKTALLRFGKAEDETAYADAAELAAALNKTNVKAFADEVSKYIEGSGIANVKNESSNTNTISVPKADAGYYFIKNTGNAGQGKAYTKFVMKVVADAEFTPKTDVPSFEKKIKDTNDTTGDTSGWQDSADYDIGDQVPFQLKGIVASNYDDYKTYYFAFHDKEEKVKVTDAEGNESEVPVLNFNANSVKVAVDGKELSKDKYNLVTKTKDGCTFEVVFNNLKDISAVKKSSVITVDYTSELTANANIGSQGNINQAKLEFSNNPNNEQGGKPDTGETPWDNVIVFTYKVVINKVDGDNNNAPLSGAEFTLSKKLKDGSKKDIAVVKNTAGTKFTFSGLDDGDYVLTETTTPSGYNTIAPITFKVTAAHDIVWTTQKRDVVLTSLSGNKFEGEITLVADKKEGSLTSDVVNKSGSTLPSTGGIGTTIFYVVGVILMLGAGVLLVTKKRMSANR